MLGKSIAFSKCLNFEYFQQIYQIIKHHKKTSIIIIFENSSANFLTLNNMLNISNNYFVDFYDCLDYAIFILFPIRNQKVRQNLEQNLSRFACPRGLSILITIVFKFCDIKHSKKIAFKAISKLILWILENSQIKRLNDI